MPCQILFDVRQKQKQFTFKPDNNKSCYFSGHELHMKQNNNLIAFCVKEKEKKTNERMKDEVNH